MEPFCFKNWSNKKYAILNTLHRVIRIGTLSFVYSLLQLQPLLAQHDTTAPVMFFDLEEVEHVTDAGAEIYPPGLQLITTIPALQITESPAPSLSELLDAYPFTDLRTRGYHSIQSDLGLQGGSFDQSLVLLNGINISDPQTGHFNLDLPMSHRQLKQVELITGPATRTYGPNAYSGAVNLVTAPGDSVSLEAGLMIGDYGYSLTEAALQLPWQHTGTLLTFSSSRSEGYIENTDFSQSGLFLHSTIERPVLKTDLMAGWNRKNFGANSFYSPLYPEQYEETGLRFVALKVQLTGSRPRIDASLYFRQHDDHFLLFRSDPARYENFHQTAVAGSDYRMRFFTRQGVTTAGFTLRYEQIISSSLGIALPESRTSGRKNSALYRFGYSRTQPSISLNHLLEKGPMKVSAGVLIHTFSRQKKVGLYPGADLSLTLSPNWTLTTSANRSMRLPTFTDLFYSGPRNEGNAALETEKAITFETGVQYNAGWISGRGSTFYRIGRETIDWILLEDGKWHTQNITDLNTYGGEVSLTLIPELQRAGDFHLTQVRTAYSYTELNKSSDAFISHYALDNLRHKWVLEAGLDLPAELSITYLVRFYARNGYFLNYETDSDQPNEERYAPYLLNDISLRYESGPVAIFLDVTNLLNVEYNNLGSVIQPGRWVMGGVRLNR